MPQLMVTGKIEGNSGIGRKNYEKLRVEEERIIFEVIANIHEMIKVL